MSGAVLPTMADRPANATPGTVHWMVRRHAGGSDKFGPCEVCRAHVDTVYHQSAVVAYADPDLSGGAWTYHNAPPSAWGCLPCLLSLRAAK